MLLRFCLCAGIFKPSERAHPLLHSSSKSLQPPHRVSSTAPRHYSPRDCNALGAPNPHPPETTLQRFG
jgi:hypothetical protein